MPTLGFETYEANSVDAAIELAERFKREGRYNLFRGQLHPWPPHSSLFRRQQTQDQTWEHEFKVRMVRFYEWCKRTPEVAELIAPDNVHQFFAVQQHYGFPTHYIDFTTDPAVAGFFAADGAPPKDSAHACLYLLDSQDVLSDWPIHQKVIKEKRGLDLPEIEIVDVKVKDLWRLQAQHGAFLFSPMNWDVFYPMDRILFPHSGPPAYPAKQTIYPDRKSRLEVLLDTFFAEERAIRGTREMLEELRRNKIKMDTDLWEAPAGGYHPQMARGGKLDPHPSWSNLAAWRAMPDEDVRKIQRREVPLAVDLGAPPHTVRERLTAGIRRVFERDRDLRSHHVEWTFTSGAADAKPEPRDGMLNGGLRLIWDGMRSLPYTDDQLAAALGTWPAVWKLGVHTTPDAKKSLELMGSLFGPCTYVEMGKGSAAAARGYVSNAALKRALRPDLDAVLAEDELENRDDLRRLLLGIFTPSKLFEHAAFVDLFAREVIPTQMLRWMPKENSNAFFFSPAVLDTFGLP